MTHQRTDFESELGQEAIAGRHRASEVGIYGTQRFGDCGVPY
jgi:hypothetical protein